MEATKKGNFKPIKLPEQGTYVARCYSVIHIGTVDNVFGGKIDPKSPKKELIYITWELPELKAVFNDDKGPEPFVVGRELALSTNEKSILAMLIKQWRGKELSPEEQMSFDPSVMVGKTCLMSVIYKTKSKFKGQNLTEITNENTNLNMSAIMPKLKQMECPANINAYYVWDWDKDGSPFNAEKFAKMPKWLQNKVATSDEYKKFGPKTSGDTSQPAANNAPAAQAGGVADDWG